MSELALIKKKKKEWKNIALQPVDPAWFTLAHTLKETNFCFNLGLKAKKTETRWHWLKQKLLPSSMQVSVLPLPLSLSGFLLSPIVMLETRLIYTKRSHCKHGRSLFQSDKDECVSPVVIR